MVILLEFNMCNSEGGEHLRCKSIPFVEGNMEYYVKFAYSLFLQYSSHSVVHQPSWYSHTTQYRNLLRIYRLRRITNKK